MSIGNNLSLLSNDAGHKGSQPVSVDAQLRAHDVWITIVIILAFFYGVGRLIGNPRSFADTIWLLIAILVTCRSLIHQHLLQNLPTTIYYYVVGTFTVQIGVAVLSPKWKKEPRSKGNYGGDPFLKPMLFPCRTTHTRMFPIKHSFSYSYLFVGIPVEWNGSAGTLLSTGNNPEGRAWFSVHEDDYLARGRNPNGLYGKLKDYLQSQGVPQHHYVHAYLVTAPRFLGFSFNPVSFWYLYDQSKRLSAMILEVNNTFDERRMYLLESVSGDGQASTKPFTSSWDKDFHVSPFNGRDGSYSLTAKDISSSAHMGWVDNNIVLRDNEAKAKVVARVFSTKSGLDPMNLSKLATVDFLIRWGWVGFMTNPRILREARTLWIKKLQVYYRPEIFRTSIGRNETKEEGSIEPYFRAFLTDLIRSSAIHVTVAYSPAAGSARGNIIKLYPSDQGTEIAGSQNLDVHVLTPAFYAEIVRARSIEHAFTRFCFAAAECEAMLHISDHDRLKQGLQRCSLWRQKKSPPVRIHTSEWVVSHLRKGTRSLFRDALNKVRGRKANPCELSDFDQYVRLSHSPVAYKAYLRHTIRLLLADRIAYGFGSLLSLYGITIRVLCVAQISRRLESRGVHSLYSDGLLSLVIWTVLGHGVDALLFGGR